MSRYSFAFCLLVILLVGTGGCSRGGEPLRPPAANDQPGYSPDAAPADVTTSTARPTSTPLPLSSPEPSPTPIPVPSETPGPPATATPAPEPTPLPEELLVRGSETMQAAGSYHFGWSVVYESEEGTREVTFSGDFQKPRNYAGTVITAEGKRIELVTIGDDVYSNDAPRGEWREASWSEVAGYGLPLTPDLPAGVLQDMEYVGQELFNEEAVHHIRGVMPAGEAGPDGSSTRSDSVEEYWLGVADGRFYKVRSSYSTTSGGETVEVQLTKHFSDYDLPVEIAAPEIVVDTMTRVSVPLAIVFQLPEGWAGESWGEAGCVKTNCRGERIALAGQAGQEVGLSIALLADGDVAAAREALPGAETREVSGQELLWSQGDGRLEGLLLLDEAALQLRGQWVDERQGAQMEDMVMSMLPFTTVTIPGWASLQLPAGWEVLYGPEPGWFEVSGGEKVTGEEESAEAYGDHLRIWLTGQEGDPALSSYERLQQRMDELEGMEGFFLLTPLHKAQINGQEAVQAAYIPGDPLETPAETITIYQGVDKSLTLMIAWLVADPLDVSPLVDLIVQSLWVQASLEPPRMPELDEIPQEYGRFEGEGFVLRYPPGWTHEAGQVWDMFLPPGAEVGPQVFDTSGVLISDEPMWGEPVLRGDRDGTLEELLVDAYALEWLFRPDVQMVSDMLLAARGEQELGAVMVAASGLDGRPQLGLLGVIRQGETLFRITAWVDDYETHREAIENLLASLELTGE